MLSDQVGTIMLGTVFLFSEFSYAVITMPSGAPEDIAARACLCPPPVLLLHVRVRRINADHFQGPGDDSGRNP